MKSFPLPVRIAAGLVASAVEQVKHLPEQAAELPVSVVSGVLRMSMRLQQQVTDLAIKGDEVLASLRPTEENPSWATFDEDLPNEAAPTSDEGKTAASERPLPEPTATTEPTGNHPAGIAGYYGLSLAQLRTRLRRLSPAELEEILVYERAHANRTSFIGMVARRIGVLQQTVQAEAANRDNPVENQLSQSNSVNQGRETNNASNISVTPKAQQDSATPLADQ